MTKTTELPEELQELAAKRDESIVDIDEARAEKNPAEEQKRLINHEATSMKELRKELSQIGLLETKAVIYNADDPDDVKIPKMASVRVAKVLTEKLNFALIGESKDSAMLYYYDLDKGIYVSSTTDIQSFILLIDDKLELTNWKNVIAKLRALAPLTETLQDPNLIPVNNGIYNRQTKSLEPFRSKYIITSKIVTDYNPKAKNPKKYFDVDAFILQLAEDDEEVATLLWQVVNESINPNFTRKKIGFLYGEGNTGKGTFQQLLINLIGQSNIASLLPDQFQDKFKPYALLGKTANLGDDISNRYIEDLSNLMSVATGDSIQIEQKYGGTIAVNLKLFCLFSTNEMPKTRNKSTGWYRRLLLIPFNAEFSKLGENTKIKTEYIYNKGVLEYVLKKAIEQEFDEFITPQAVRSLISEYKNENDFIAAYISDEYIPSGFHELEKVPSNFIKAELERYIDYRRIKVSLPYGYMKSFAKTLSEQTGNEYEPSAVVKYNSEEIEALKNLTDDPYLFDYVKEGKSARSVKCIS